MHTNCHKQIVFVISLPKEYGQLFMKTKAAHHRFVYNREATLQAMKDLLDSLSFEKVEL